VAVKPATLEARPIEGGVTAPMGWRAGTAACGIKAFTAGATAIPTGQRDDLAVIHSEMPCDSGGVFTTNKVKSASVVIDQLHLQQNRARALVVNSGNANACTGAQGFRDALQMAKLTADRLDLDPPQVLVGSTGVIGRFLPMDAIKVGIASACGALDLAAGPAAAKAIMTTDTVPKTAGLELEVGGETVRVGGMAKGSGMIHPNLATMLSYVTTDAAVETGWVASIVKRVADRSFNQVTVDGDSSTNDTFLILANGAAGNRPVVAGSAESEVLEEAILEVARQLARSIARDGEGATKLITVRVRGAQDDLQARLAARAVAASSLVKTAIHGGDPNWGRIVCALGYSGSELALDRLRLSIGGLDVFDRGAGVDADLSQVRASFEQPEIEIHAELGLGEGRAEAWGCDLTAEYVRINAEYTT
jgi:glutamate N-acetyltransferase/amino-acid N-acetyltransferase